MFELGLAVGEEEVQEDEAEAPGYPGRRGPCRLQKAVAESTRRGRGLAGFFTDARVGILSVLNQKLTLDSSLGLDLEHQGRASQ